MPAVPRYEFLTEEERRDIDRRRAEITWEAGRAYREEEARRRKEALEQLYIFYQPALNSVESIPFPAPLSSRAL